MKILLQLTTIVLLASRTLAQSGGVEKHVKTSWGIKRMHTSSQTHTVNSQKQMQSVMREKFQQANEEETMKYNGMQGIDSSQVPMSNNHPDNKADTSDGDGYYSPPFYPTPQVEGRGNWKDAVRKAKEYVKKFNTEDRVALVTGVGWDRGPR